MDITPFVTRHRPQRLDFFGRTAAASISIAAPAAGAGRQNVLDNEAGTGQSQQIQKADEIDNKIHRCAFHKITYKYGIVIFGENFRKSKNSKIQDYVMSIISIEQKCSYEYIRIIV